MPQERGEDSVADRRARDLASETASRKRTISEEKEFLLADKTYLAVYSTQWPLQVLGTKGA